MLIFHSFYLSKLFFNNFKIYEKKTNIKIKFVRKYIKLIILRENISCILIIN